MRTNTDAGRQVADREAPPSERQHNGALGTVVVDGRSIEVVGQLVARNLLSQAKKKKAKSARTAKKFRRGVAHCCYGCLLSSCCSRLAAHLLAPALPLHRQRPARHVSKPMSASFLSNAALGCPRMASNDCQKISESDFSKFALAAVRWPHIRDYDSLSLSPLFNFVQPFLARRCDFLLPG